MRLPLPPSPSISRGIHPARNINASMSMRAERRAVHACLACTVIHDRTLHGLKRLLSACCKLQPLETHYRRLPLSHACMPPLPLRLSSCLDEPDNCPPTSYTREHPSLIGGGTAEWHPYLLVSGGMQTQWPAFVMLSDSSMAGRRPRGFGKPSTAGGRRRATPVKSHVDQHAGSRSEVFLQLSCCREMCAGLCVRSLCDWLVLWTLR